MSELREKIADEIGTIAAAVVEDQSVAISGIIHRNAADAILAAVAEALTSDAAVDKAVDGYWGADPDVPRDYGDMQRAITVALRAAGIVKGEGDE